MENYTETELIKKLVDANRDLLRFIHLNKEIAKTAIDRIEYILAQLDTITVKGDHDA